MAKEIHLQIFAIPSGNLLPFGYCPSGNVCFYLWKNLREINIAWLPPMAKSVPNQMKNKIEFAISTFAIVEELASA